MNATVNAFQINYYFSLQIKTSRDKTTNNYRQFYNINYACEYFN